jgi:hypothetical protein
VFFAGEILLTEFFNHDDLLGVTHVNSRPLFPCYEAEDLIRPWWTFVFILSIWGILWFKSREIVYVLGDISRRPWWYK